jgi:hypothetical protein
MINERSDLPASSVFIRSLELQESFFLSECNLFVPPFKPENFKRKSVWYCRPDIEGSSSSYEDTWIPVTCSLPAKPLLHLLHVHIILALKRQATKNRPESFVTKQGHLKLDFIGNKNHLQTFYC